MGKYAHELPENLPAVLSSLYEKNTMRNEGSERQSSSRGLVMHHVNILSAAEQNRPRELLLRSHSRQAKVCKEEVLPHQHTQSTVNKAIIWFVKSVKSWGVQTQKQCRAPTQTAL